MLTHHNVYEIMFKQLRNEVYYESCKSSGRIWFIYRITSYMFRTNSDGIILGVFNEV